MSSGVPLHSASGPPQFRSAEWPRSTRPWSSGADRGGTRHFQHTADATTAAVRAAGVCLRDSEGDAMNVLEATEVVKTFREGAESVTVLKGANLALKRGEIVALE